MKTSLPLNEEIPNTEPVPTTVDLAQRDGHVSYEANEPRFELGLWLQAVRSFFDPRNHPFLDAEHATILTRDWSDELIIARQVLIRISQVTLRMVHLEGEVDGRGNEGADTEDFNHEQARGALVDLAESVGDVAVVCDAILKSTPVSFYAWSTIGRMLSRELNRSLISHSIQRLANRKAGANLPAILNERARSSECPEEFRAEIQIIISDLSRLLDRLRIVEACLKRDQPLKQTLPVFCLIYEEARFLLDFVDVRVLQVENLDRNLFDALDGLNYAIAMELRKVFSRELVGIAALRQAPAVYAKVENAHGLLRDSFQQSIVGVAQLVDSKLDVAHLFGTFQTRLEQSLALRKDIWNLLNLVRRAENERERYPISLLLEKLNSFREGSLRYLMYKDWEACERFMEEVAAARGAVEVTPVVHRFGAYLETLLGQINMRSVLIDHAFDYSISES